MAVIRGGHATGWPPAGGPRGRASDRRPRPELPASPSWWCRPRSARAVTRSTRDTGSSRRTRKLSRSRSSSNGHHASSGPPPEVIELTGDKLRGPRDGRGRRVAVVPGREVGDAGGGGAWPPRTRLSDAAQGRGRRRRARHQARPSHTRTCARCSASRWRRRRLAFGDDRVYVERFVAARPAHRGAGGGRRARRRRAPGRA